MRTPTPAMQVLYAAINAARRAKDVAQSWPERHAQQRIIDTLRAQLAALKQDPTMPTPTEDTPKH